MADIVVINVAQLNAALASYLAGDRILVRGAGGGGSTGYYQTTNDTTGISEVRLNSGFHFHASGTPQSPVILMGYPGDPMPTLANRPSGSTAYFRFPTLTLGEHSNIHIIGIKIDGAPYAFCTGFTCTAGVLTGGQSGNLVEDCEIIEGWETPDDGNWAGIRGEGQTGLILRNNYIHAINQFGNCTNSASACAIKLFSCTDTIDEFNTGISVNSNTSQAACVDDKADSFRNDHRYLWFEDVQNGPRIQNQASSGGAGGASGTRFRHIVVILKGNVGSRGFTQEEGPISNYEVSNLTVVKRLGAAGVADDGLVYAANSDYPFVDGQHGATFKDNIHFGPTSFNNISAYTSMFIGGLCNYNHYSDSSKDFRTFTSTFGSLALWQGAGHDLNASSGNPLFENDATDLHLQAGSPCRNSGSTGGHKGAYTATVKGIGHGARTPTGLQVVP